MDHRTPLQHLLHHLLPSFAQPQTAAVRDFEDMRPEARRAPPQAAAPFLQQSSVWSESAIDLVLGSEIVEFPDDTIIDVMDAYFDSPERRAS